MAYRSDAAPQQATVEGGGPCVGRTREGYRQPEERTLTDLMVGHRVVLRYAVGPEPDPDDPDREVTGHLLARTGAYWLHAVSYHGLVVSRELADRLEDPQEGDANLGLDVRRFLGFNPYDEEVRAALGRLPREYLYP